jgi:predicted Fe-Mo cluster-binding NifX family protein
MKVAISSFEKDLNSQVDPRFGRTPYILIVDSDTMQYEVLENPSATAAGGAGIQTAQMVTEKGAQVVLTGNIGPNAFDVLSAADIEVITGIRGTVESAVKRYLQGQLQPTAPHNIPSNSGRDKDMSRTSIGLGHRRIGGFGPGGMGPMVPIGTYTKNQKKSQSEIEILKQQAEVLKLKLEQINRRVKELEGKESC